MSDYPTRPHRKYSMFTRLVCVGLLSLLLAGASVHMARAQRADPETDLRRLWVPELEALLPREFPAQLTEQAPHAASVAAASIEQIALPDASFSFRFDRYPSAGELNAFIYELEAAYPHLLEVYEVGRSWQDRPILALRLGNERSGDPDQRPAYYVDGQHHAQEAISAQAPLYFVWYLATAYGQDAALSHLLDTRTVYAIPSVNPDGNDIFLTSWQGMRKTANPASSDEDGDGRFDEDGVEGDGLGSFNLYAYEFEQDWADAHPDNPFQPGWRSHLINPVQPLGVYDANGQLVLQVDNDGDAKTSEDTPGGVDANRNYDSHWDAGNGNPSTPIYRGPAPFSEPETRAVRDFIATHPNISLASTHHSGADVLLYPWGWSAAVELPDGAWFESMSRKGSQLTERNGFNGTPHTWTASGFYPGAGSTMDWLYSQGILAWTPEVYGASTLHHIERQGTGGIFHVGLAAGIGYNPPASEIALTLDRWLQWNLYVLAATPSLIVSDIHVQSGELLITVSNDGLIASDIDVSLEMEGRLYQNTVEYLSDATSTLRFPIPAARRSRRAKVTVSGAPQLGIGSSSTWQTTLEIVVRGNGAIQVRQGELLAAVDNSRLFGGWYSTADAYHMGASVELLSAQADFAVDVNAGTTPLTVNFADLSQGQYLARSWEFGDGAGSDDANPSHTYTAPGAYDVRLTISGWGETASLLRPALIEVSGVDLTTPRYLLLSTKSGGRVDGIAFRDEDILAYDTLTGAWALLVDGSDLGLRRSDINALHAQADGSLLLSVNRDIRVGPLKITDNDVILLTPQQLGAESSGEVTRYLQGSAVALSGARADIDALALADDDTLVVSTLGNVRVHGWRYKDEDLLRGPPATATWAPFFDGSAHGLGGRGVDLSGVWLPEANEFMVLAASPRFVVDGNAGSVVACIFNAGDPSAPCHYRTLWTLQELGLVGEEIDALSFSDTLSLPLQAASLPAAQEEEATDPDEYADDDIYEVFFPVFGGTSR